jgi:hypothetical protein
VTDLICRQRYIDSNGKARAANGHFVDDLITVSVFGSVVGRFRVILDCFDRIWVIFVVFE